MFFFNYHKPTIQQVGEVFSDRFFALEKTGKVSPIYVNRFIREVTAEIGLEKEVSVHILRHSFGTNFLEKGALIEYLQKYGFKGEIETLLKNE